MLTNSVASSITIVVLLVGVTMTAEEWKQELEDQLLEEKRAGLLSSNYYYDDSSIVVLELEYSTSN